MLNISIWCLISPPRFAESKDNDNGDGKKLTTVLKMLINLTHVDTEVSCVTTGRRVTPSLAR